MSDRINVLQVGMGNNPGGVEAFVMNYYRVLVNSGVHFDFVCMYGEIAYADEIRKMGGKIYLLPNVKKNYFGYVNGFVDVLKREKYDIIHVNMLSAANLVPLRLAHDVGIVKVIAHSHNSSAPGIIRKIMDRINRSKIDQYADMKLACDVSAANWMFGEAEYKAGKVSIINNAIEIEKYMFSESKRHQLREREKWNGRFVIGHVGRFELQKNHSFILKVFREVVVRDPNAVLCLIGDGKLKIEIEKKAEEYGLSDNTCFVGKIDHVEEYLSAMDVFLLPSLFEGLPFTLVEAQANGLPCVISDVITENVHVLDTMVSVSLSESPEVWAENLLGCKKKKRPDREFIQNRMTEKHFNINEEADRLKRFYQELV